MMHSLGYNPSKSDTNVWMKDISTYYNYVCVYVDDLVFVGRNPYGFFSNLMNLGYKLKGVGIPSYHLGGDFKSIDEPNTNRSTLVWVEVSYLKRMLENYKKLLNEEVPKRSIHDQLDPSDHPELDTT